MKKINNYYISLLIYIFLVLFYSQFIYAEDQLCQSVQKFIELSQKVTGFSIDNIERFKIKDIEIPDNDKGNINKNIEKCWNKNGCNNKPCADILGREFAKSLIEVENNHFKVKKLLTFMDKIFEKFENSNFKTSYKILYAGLISELASNYSSLKKYNNAFQYKDIKTKGQYWASQYLHFNQVKEISNKFLNLLKASDGIDSRNRNDKFESITQNNSSDEIEKINMNIKQLWKEINRLQSQINALK